MQEYSLQIKKKTCCWFAKCAKHAKYAKFENKNYQSKPKRPTKPIQIKPTPMLVGTPPQYFGLQVQDWTKSAYIFKINCLN